MSYPQTLIQMAGGTPKKASWQDAALILIDHQTEYTTGALPLVGIESAIAEMVQLLQQTRQAGARVFHVVHHARPHAALFDPQRQWVDIIDAVQPLATEQVVIKSLPNAFAATTLDTLLKQSGKKELVIAGFATHMCISATTRSALDHGYATTVIAAACATRDLPDPVDGSVLPAAQVHRAALAALADRFATVLPDAAALLAV